MSSRLLPDWLTAYLEYTSYQEAPKSFHFWTGVATIAAALRRKVFFDQLYYTWSPNFYIILVAPPGVSKSSAMSIGMNMLDDIQGIKKGADALTWQALVQSMENAAEMIQVADGSFVAMSCLTFAASELGSLLDPDDRKMLDVLTDLWDGKSGVREKATKTMGGNRVANPWINIVAGTTPTWIANNMPRQAIGAGFCSRCVFVYEEKKDHLMAYPKYSLGRNGSLEKMRELKLKLLKDLEQIAMLQGEYDLDCDDTVTWGEDWYKQHHENPSVYLAGDEQFSGYLNRKQGHAHKLAIVMAASRSNALVLTKPILEGATKIMTQLEKQMPEVFRYINTSDEQSKTLKIIEKVRSFGKPVSKDSVYRLFLREMSHKEYNEALNSAIMAGELRLVNRDNGFFLEAL